jgi:hypothetical protein
MEPYYTVPYLCKEYDIKSATVHTWIRKGWLHSFRLGTIHRILVAEWEKFLEESKTRKAN